MDERRTLALFARDPGCGFFVDSCIGLVHTCRMRTWPILAVLVIFGVCRPAMAVGPVEHPENLPDFGGTPDLVLSGDVGMTAEELEALLGGLDAESLEERVQAASELKRNAAGGEGIIRQYLWHAGHFSHREIRDVMKKASGAAAEMGVAGALIQMSPRSPAINMTTRIAMMLVALSALDTMAGYKVLLDFSARYAGAFRGFIGELLVKAGLKALPALIYGRGSKNRELHMFAVAWIRDMGNPLLSEQIQGIRSSRRLAQLLEAYASVNELDAIDVTLSCANHESEIVRKAARASLAVYGQNAKWSIHREFENAFGDEPESGDYEQWVEALYMAWDKARESKTLALLEQGQKAVGEGKYEEMDDSYRELLAVSPLNPHRTQMAEDYLRYAAKLTDDGEHQNAILATQMARRLAEQGSAPFQKASSRLTWLRAEKMRSSGALDVVAYQSFGSDSGADDEASKWARYGSEDDQDQSFIPATVIPVSLIVFAGFLLIYLRIRGQRMSRTRQS